MRYLLRRLTHSVVLLLAIATVSFAVAQLAPGDYFSEMRNDPRVSSGTLAALRAQAGLNRPLPVRYAIWIGSVLRGDFGYSLAYRTEAGPLLRQRVRATLLLSITATFLSWLIAIPLGVWTATNRHRWPDAFSNAALAGLMTVPELLLAVVALAAGASSGWFPSGGMVSPWLEEMGRFAHWRDVAWHLTLPAGVLVLSMLPVLVRHVRASMVEVLESPFAENARAMGIPWRRRLFRHLLPAAVNPLVSLFGLSLGTLLSASLLVEVVMGWPGLGPLFLDAIMTRDLAIVLGTVMLSAAFLVGGNLAADLLLYRLDPRIRAR